MLADAIDAIREAGFGMSAPLSGGPKTLPYCNRATFTTFTSWFLFSCMLIFELPAKTSSSVMIFP